MLHELKPAQAPMGPVATRANVHTEAGTVVCEATAGRVITNGVALLPFEARILAAELVRCAGIADREAEGVAAQVTYNCRAA